LYGEVLKKIGFEVKYLAAQVSQASHTEKNTYNTYYYYRR